MCVCVSVCVCVCVCLSLQRVSLCVSVHRNAGKVVPDDLVNCGERREDHC